MLRCLLRVGRLLQRLRVVAHYSTLICLLFIMAALMHPSLGVSTYPCVPPCSCAKHNQTLTIDCTGLGLTSFPADLPLTYKYKLIFAHNKLSLLDVHGYFKRVAYLDLSHNELSEVNPHAIFEMQEQLRVLMLHGNRLSHIPQQLAVTSFKHLEQLTLHENPLICDCRSKWLKSWLRNTSNILHKQDIICTNRNLYGRPVMAVPDDLFPCKLRALEKASDALRHIGNPVVIFVILILATVFMWLAIFLLYKFCKTSAEIKWMEGARWTALVETE